MKNKNNFYAVMDEKQGFVLYVERGLSSSKNDYVVLDLAPSSATFFNSEDDAYEVKSICDLKYPDKTFTVKSFQY